MVSRPQRYLTSVAWFFFFVIPFWLDLPNGKYSNWWWENTIFTKHWPEFGFWGEFSSFLLPTIAIVVIVIFFLPRKLMINQVLVVFGILIWLWIARPQLAFTTSKQLTVHVSPLIFGDGAHGGCLVDNWSPRWELFISSPYNLDKFSTTPY